MTLIGLASPAPSGCYWPIGRCIRGNAPLQQRSGHKRLDLSVALRGEVHGGAPPSTVFRSIQAKRYRRSRGWLCWNGLYGPTADAFKQQQWGKYAHCSYCMFNPVFHSLAGKLKSNYIPAQFLLIAIFLFSSDDSLTSSAARIGPSTTPSPALYLQSPRPRPCATPWSW